MKKIFTTEEEPNVWYVHSDYYKYIPNVVKQVQKIHENSCDAEISLCLSDPCNSYLVFYLEDVESFINDVQKEYEIEYGIQMEEEERQREEEERQREEEEERQKEEEERREDEEVQRKIDRLERLERKREKERLEKLEKERLERKKERQRLERLERLERLQRLERLEKKRQEAKRLEKKRRDISDSSKSSKSSTKKKKSYSDEDFIDDLDKYSQEENIEEENEEEENEEEENMEEENVEEDTVIEEEENEENEVEEEEEDELSFDFNKLANKTQNKYSQENKENKEKNKEDKYEEEEEEISDMENQILLELLNNKYYKNIVSFLSIMIFPDINEIWNVCTVKSSRDKGISKKIFSSLIKEFIDKALWLAVSLTDSENRKKDNPFLAKLINLYTSLGFIPKEIVFSSPSEFFWNYPNLSMVLPKDRTFVGEYIDKHREESLKIINSFNKTKGVCKIKYNIEPKTMNEIYEFISEDEEFSGILEPNKKKDEYILTVKRIIKGTSEGENFTVINPPSFINWHTHPFICYVRGNCFIQWPSGQDLSYIFANHTRGHVLHFVFSEEGVYGISLTKEIMFLLRFMSYNCMYYLSELIRFYFTKFEQYRSIEYDKEREKCFEENYDDFRCYTYNNEVKHKSINAILKEMDTLTFKKLLKNEENDPPGVTEIKKGIKNTGCLNKAINLYNSTGLFGPFENANIFHLKFIYQENAKKGGLKDDVDYYLPPGEIYCK
jgi:hypothetical protein